VGEIFQKVLNAGRACAHDADVEFSYARDEDVEAIPGFVDRRALDADEVDGAHDAEATVLNYRSSLNGIGTDSL
jgi:hypothetical protein